MKKICSLFSSPHKHGTTAAMLNILYDAIGNDNQITEFDIYRKSPMACTDCGYCKEHDGCSNDDMEDIYKSIEDSDILIISSPIYNMSVPSPLKAVMDRFQRYYNARFFLEKRPAIEKHRKALLLLTAGSITETGEFVKKQFKQCFSVMNTEIVGCIVCNGTDSGCFDKGEDIVKMVNNLLQK